MENMPRLANHTRSADVPMTALLHRHAHSVTVPQSCRLIRKSLRRSCPKHLSRAEEKGRDSDDSLEKLLWKEMEKRGIRNIEDLQRRERAGQTSTKQVEPSPMMSEKARNQLEESRKLNSEGLEGLIPRGKQLASLGGSFFLAFWPFLIVLSGLFTLVFLLSGENFIHGGRPSYTKSTYVSPEQLLQEPTVDERIPFR